MSSVGTKALQTVWNGPNTGCLAPGVRQRAKEKKKKKKTNILIDFRWATFVSSGNKK